MRNLTYVKENDIAFIFIQWLTNERIVIEIFNSFLKYKIKYLKIVQNLIWTKKERDSIYYNKDKQI